MIRFYNVVESQERKEPCILRYLVHRVELTNISNDYDNSLVVVSGALGSLVTQRFPLKRSCA